MSEQDPATLITVIGGLFGAGGFFTWVAKLWAQIRREEIQAKREESALQRSDNERTREAMLEQVRSNAVMHGRFDHLADQVLSAVDGLAVKLDAIGDRLPRDDDDARRARRALNGSRLSRDEHDD